MAVLGGLATGASALLPWFKDRGETFVANDIPALVLLRYPDRVPEFRLGYLVVSVAALVVLASLLRAPVQGWALLILSALGLAVVVAFVAQLLREVYDRGAGDVRGYVGDGVVVAGAGLLLALVGSLGGLRRRRPATQTAAAAGTAEAPTVVGGAAAERLSGGDDAATRVAPPPVGAPAPWPPPRRAKDSAPDTCPTCERPISPEHNFCNYCGTRLAG